MNTNVSTCEEGVYTSLEERGLVPRRIDVNDPEYRVGGKKYKPSGLDAVRIWPCLLCGELYFNTPKCKSCVRKEYKEYLKNGLFYRSFTRTLLIDVGHSPCEVQATSIRSVLGSLVVDVLDMDFRDSSYVVCVLASCPNRDRRRRH